jgi:hypothetical protein
MPHIFSNYSLSDLKMISNSKSTGVVTGKNTGLSPGVTHKREIFGAIDHDSARLGTTAGMKKAEKDFCHRGAEDSDRITLELFGTGWKSCDSGLKRTFRQDTGAFGDFCPPEILWLPSFPF